jgi:hypothetical protein
MVTSEKRRNVRCGERVGGEGEQSWRRREGKGRRRREG